MTLREEFEKKISSNCKAQTEGLFRTNNRYYIEWLEYKVYNFAQKQVKDSFNHYNSKLKEATKPKLDRKDRTEYIIKLEAKVELLKELLKKM